MLEKGWGGGGVRINRVYELLEILRQSSFCMEAYSCEHFLGHILQVQCKLLYMQSSTLQSARTELNGVHMQIYITANTKWLVVSKVFSYTQGAIVGVFFPH